MRTPIPSQSRVEVGCGLNVKCPPRLMHLNMSPQLVGLLWEVVEPLVGGALLEDIATGGGS